MVNKVRTIVATIAVIVFGVVFIVLGFKDRQSLGNAKDINDVGSFISGTYVKGVTDEVIDWYCNETSEKNGSKTETYRWYYVWYGDDANSMEPGKCGYIGVKVPAKEFDKYEKMKDSGLEYELTYQGVLRKCDGDIAKYKNQFESDWQKFLNEEAAGSGVTAPKIADYCPDFYVELKTTKQANIMLVVGLVALGIGVALFLFGLATMKKNKLEEGTYGFVQQPYGTIDSATVNATNATLAGATDLTTGQAADANVGAASGFNLYGEQDELSKMLAEEDQKVSEYNFETNLTGSDRIEDDK